MINIKKYEINSNTLALISDGKITRIYEDDQIYRIKKSATDIMEDSCIYFGSSLIGRRKGTNNLIGVTHKAPIIVEETKEIIFFPLSSPRLEDCSWVSLNNIERYYKEGSHIVIIFKNNRKIRLNLAYNVFDNQILRATRLESVLRGRKRIKML